MAKTGVMEAIAAKRGKSVEQIITEAYNEEGSIDGAARALGVNKGTIRHYLDKFGYRRVKTLRHEKEPRS